MVGTTVPEHKKCNCALNVEGSNRRFGHVAGYSLGIPKVTCMIFVHITMLSPIGWHFHKKCSNMGG
jgi:hypothetical protein